MRSNEQDLSLEERKRRFFERLDNGYYFRPSVAVLSLPVTEQLAEAVTANPESVRVSARRADGVSVVGGPRGNPNHVSVRVDLVK
jgi:hypothetical protein